MLVYWRKAENAGDCKRFMKMNNVGGFRPKRHKKQPEFELQAYICRYLRLQYPKVVFLSDTVASVKLTPAQANRNKQIQKSGFKIPDLLILEPNSKYAGLMIELKVKDPHKLNGDIKADVHLKGQEKSIQVLNEKGYYSCFSWDFEMTKNIIDKYLKE